MSRVVKDSEKRITQGYGSGYEGIDIGWRANEEENKVFALTVGTVIQVVDGKNHNPGSTGTESYGNFVMIRHENGLESTYAHLQKGIRVKIGDKVTKDTQIGVIGESGNAHGRHLHLRIKKNGTLVDPKQYLNAELEPTSVNKKEQIFLPSNVETWRVYPLNKQPIIGNECGILYPSRFGGLTYDILEWKIPNQVAVIQTRDYGKVQIYVDPSKTSAKIKK